MSDPTTEPIAKPAKPAAKRARKPSNSESATGNAVRVAESPGSHTPPVVAVKRAKRRRGKKGKGGGEPQPREDAAEATVEIPKPPSQEPPKPEKPCEPPPQYRPPQSPQLPRHDPADLSNKAWKIYLAEVSEEGIALINDQDAREVARRCFRLAEVFLDEQARCR